MPRHEARTGRRLGRPLLEPRPVHAHWRPGRRWGQSLLGRLVGRSRDRSAGSTTAPSRPSVPSIPSVVPRPSPPPPRQKVCGGGGGERRIASVGRSVLSRRRHVPDFEVRRAARDCTLSLLFGGTAEQRRSARARLRDAALRTAAAAGAEAGPVCRRRAAPGGHQTDKRAGGRGRTTGRGPRRMRTTSPAASLFPSLSKFR